MFSKCCICNRMFGMTQFTTQFSRSTFIKRKQFYGLTIEYWWWRNIIFKNFLFSNPCMCFSVPLTFPQNWCRLICNCAFIFCTPAGIVALHDKHIIDGCQDQISAALLEHTMTAYTNVSDKFRLMLRLLPEIRQISQRAEEYLYYKHLNGEVPYNSLLMEMLHSKRKWADWHFWWLPSYSIKKRGCLRLWVRTTYALRRTYVTPAALGPEPHFHSRLTDGWTDRQTNEDMSREEVGGCPAGSVWFSSVWPAFVLTYYVVSSSVTHTCSGCRCEDVCIKLLYAWRIAEYANQRVFMDKTVYTKYIYLCDSFYHYYVKWQDVPRDACEKQTTYGYFVPKFRRRKPLP